MLQVRMESLDRHLKSLEGWRQRLELKTFCLDEELWAATIDVIHQGAMDQIEALKEISQELASESITEQDAWSRFYDVRTASEVIFRECIELLGGLALRDRFTDDHICQFADELIRENARALGRQASFSIPAVDETMYSTLRRVARVSFPEWHLWTLPLVAHEYAQVAIEEAGKRGPLQLVDELATEWTDPDAPREQFENARRKARVLLADAFATYTTGPAYACSALLLRLSPVHRAPPERPSDAERAVLILKVLQTMSEAEEWKNYAGFKELVQGLRDYWSESVSSARGAELAEEPPGADERGTADAGAAPEHDRVAPTIEGKDDPPLAAPFEPIRFVTKFHDRFVTANKARFRPDDWELAYEWSQQWATDLSNKKEVLRRIDVKESHRLSDVLNAAWLCRVKQTRDLPPEKSKEAEQIVKWIETAVRATCDAIHTKASEGASGNGLPGAAPQR